MPFQRRKAGESIRLSATEHNAFIDAALDHRGHAHDIGTPNAKDLAFGQVFIKNSSGGDRSRFDCLAIDDAVIAATKVDYAQTPFFDGITPDPEDEPAHRSRVVILAQPIKSGKVGRAWIAGQFAMPIQVLDVLHTRARVLDDHTLQSGFFGPVRILAAPSVADDALCRVHMDSFDGGHCFVKVPGSGITAGTLAAPSKTSCVLAWPNPDSAGNGPPVDVPSGKNPDVNVINYGGLLDANDYVQCRINGGRITPDVDDCS